MLRLRRFCCCALLAATVWICLDSASKAGAMRYPRWGPRLCAKPTNCLPCLQVESACSQWESDERELVGQLRPCLLFALCGEISMGTGVVYCKQQIQMHASLLLRTVHKQV